MRRHSNRLTALLLALCIVLGLAACGGGKDGGDADQLSGAVYVPEFIDLGLDVDYVNSACCDGKNVYIVAETSTETEETDPDTGETYTNYDSRTGIYRVPLEGGGQAVELENFKPAYELEGGEGWYNIRSIRAGEDGSLWLTEEATIYNYDLPADFDETKDDKWNYQTGSDDKQVQRKLDSTGTELERVEAGSLQEQLKSNYIGDTATDDSGNIYACYQDTENNKSGVAVIKDGNVLFTLEGDVWDLIRLNDGRIASRYYDRSVEETKITMRVIDVEGKQWGEEYPMPVSGGSLHDGAGDYLFYYDSGDSLYGYKAESQEGERLLSWSAADINVDDVEFFSFLEDGRVVAMTRTWGSEGSRTELALLTETDASALADKTVLTYAGMYIDQQTRASIIDFNKKSDKYRIEIRDYSEYNTSDDYQAGMTKLNTEIIAGNIPDILSTDSLPVSRYAAKGYLEDLWAMIDADPDISREDLMENVFKAAEINGKLYQVFDSFAITTAIGSRKVVGDRMGWTLKELQEALATMPDGCAIFGETDTKSEMLTALMAMNLDSYVDWEKGESHFDSDAFKAALEFCNSFPAEFDYDNYNWDEADDEPTRIANGKQMLQTLYLSGFNDIQMYEAIFGGSEALYTVDTDAIRFGGSGGTYTSIGVGSMTGSMTISDDYPNNASQRVKPGEYISYVGFPREDGGVGSAFNIAHGMAISTTCKDKEGAWSFVRQMLLPQEDEDSRYGGYWYFPSNKAAFDKMAADAMEKEYITDADGKNILDAEGNPIEETKSGWGWGSLNIDIVATTQQEYDQIMELYNAIDSIVDYDASMFDIVTEQAGPYFSGDKSLDEAVKNIQDRVNLYINENR